MISVELFRLWLLCFGSLALPLWCVLVVLCVECVWPRRIAPSVSRTTLYQAGLSGYRVARLRRQVWQAKRRYQRIQLFRLAPSAAVGSF